MLAVARADAAIAVSDEARRQAVETNANNKLKEASNKDFHIEIAGFKQEKALKDIAVTQVTNEKHLEMERLKEEKRLEQQTALKRAGEMSRITVEAEAAVAQARGVAAAVVAEAEGRALALGLLADANLNRAQKEATAIMAKLDAEAQGLHKVFSTSHPNHAFSYLAMQNGLYERLADSNAKAIAGMQPKLNIWNTGGGGAEGGKAADPMAPIRGLLGSLAPMFDVVRQQMDLGIPEALASSAAIKAKPSLQVTAVSDSFSSSTKAR